MLKMPDCLNLKAKQVPKQKISHCKRLQQKRFFFRKKENNFYPVPFSGGQPGNRREDKVWKLPIMHLCNPYLIRT